MSRAVQLSWGIMALTLAFVAYGGILLDRTDGAEDWLLIIISSILLSAGSNLIGHAVFPKEKK